MFLKLAAVVVLSFLIASFVLVLAVEEMKRRQKDLEQSSPLYRGSDVRSPSTEDMHRKTLEAADAMRGKQAESFMQHQH